jgi:hypothetical protein
MQGFLIGSGIVDYKDDHAAGTVHVGGYRLLPREDEDVWSCVMDRTYVRSDQSQVLSVINRLQLSFLDSNRTDKSWWHQRWW